MFWPLANSSCEIRQKAWFNKCALLCFLHIIFIVFFFSGFSNPANAQSLVCPNDPTNLACNGGFEMPVPAPTPLGSNSLSCTNSEVDYWCSSSGTSDLFIRGGGLSTFSGTQDIPVNYKTTFAPNGEVNTWDFPAPGNDRYVGMMFFDYPNHMIEGVQTQLIKPLISGNQYTLNLHAYATRDTPFFSPSVDGKVLVFLDTVPMTPATLSIISQPSINAQILGTFTVSDGQWTAIQTSFVASSNQLQHLIIQADANPPAGTGTYIFLDDVAIRETVGNNFDLSITKTPILDCYTGGVCAFEVVITNNGTAPFNGPIQVFDDWGPGDVTFQTVSAPWTCNTIPPGTDMTCDNPSVNLAPGGGSTSFIIVLKVPETLGGQVLTNCININWSRMVGINGDSNPGNDIFCTEIIIIDCLPMES